MPPVINSAKCIACGRSAEVCSQDVFFGSENKKMPAISYPEECFGIAEIVLWIARKLE
jgi:NAD-dependent dihydropyrimidine dehydrogenase PreA subunit